MDRVQTQIISILGFVLAFPLHIERSQYKHL
jgi:hypothetical protein